MTDRELMHQALEALEYIYTETTETEDELIHAAINALRDRLAKPHIKVEGPLHVVCQCYKCVTQNRWVGLTDDDKEGFWKADQMTMEEWDTLFNEIEDVLKEKNT
jgi:hypothetical protein